jgi:hypothetical protein
LFVRRDAMIKRFGIALTLLLFFIPLTCFSQGGDEYILVYFYPQSLSPQDTLRDGPDGRAFRIIEDTFLAWVDMAPDMFFAHETRYILISKKRIRVKKGHWWPVLNKKSLFLDGKGQYALISPFEIRPNRGNPPTGEEVTVHIYPYELNARDRLQDGPLERLFRIQDNSMLIWVDLLPGAFFAHPTAYVLISKQNIRIEDGIWWPELNGRTILYGQENRVGIVSPFKISRMR